MVHFSKILKSVITVGLALFAKVVFAQVTAHSAIVSFVAKADTAQIEMSGLLDGENTLSYPISKAFEPMNSVTITNKGDTLVYKPRIIFNNKRNWFDIESLRNEIFSGASGDRERALSLWRFMRNNRIHRYEPECCNEINDPIKLLGVYGYGMCYNTNYASAFLAAGLPHSGQAYEIYSPRNGRHFVSNIRFGDEFKLLDVDLETFYLKGDNQTIASYDDIANDKYLIERVHHYGKNYGYNSFNSYLAASLYRPEPHHYFGVLRDFHTLDFNLRPGESLQYYWAPGEYYHSYGQVNNALPDDIANGKISYRTNFRNTSLPNLLTGFEKLSTFRADSITPNLHPEVPNTTSIAVLKVSSPFVIVSGYLKGDFVRQSEVDEINIYFSKDSSTWDLIWASEAIGAHTDSIGLHDNIATLSTAATYEYFIKIALLADDTVSSCGIDSLEVVTQFQVSRFFLPSLQLGENIISYSDDSPERSVEVKVEWRESTENVPPVPVSAPIYPTDGADVDALKFTFYWEESADDDIIDYEFLLSDNPLMTFPLSPSFEIYTSKSSPGTNLNRFSIPFDGMLNSESNYFWKVRAKDAEGAWSDWSPVWSFVPHGPMPPMNPAFEMKQDSVYIQWEANATGARAEYYEIHGSNQRMGFVPSESTLMDTVALPEVRMSVHDSALKTFYRMIAVDMNGNKSGASEQVQLPYPSVYATPDTLMPNQSFVLPLNTNEVYTKDAIQIFESTFYEFEIDNNVTATILHKPAWLEFNEIDLQLEGTPDFSQSVTPDSVVVRFVADNNYENEQTLLLPPFTNSAPSLTMIDASAQTEELFTTIVNADDVDLIVGDSLTEVKITYKPSWLSVSAQTESRIQLQGTPGIGDVGTAIIVAQVTDAGGHTIEKTFPFHVNLSTLFTRRIEVCAGEAVTVPIPLEGNKPWAIMYVVDSDTTIVNDVNASPYALDIETENSSSIFIATSSGEFTTVEQLAVEVKKNLLLGLSNQTAIEALPYSANIQVDNPCRSPIRFKLLNSIPWLNLDTLTGNVWGTPRPTDKGKHPLAIQLTDAYGNRAQYLTEINVEALPEPYLATLTSASRTCRGEPINLTITFNGPRPWSCSYTDGQIIYSQTNILTGEIVVPIRPLNNTSYKLVSVDFEGNTNSSLHSAAIITVDTLTSVELEHTRAYEGSFFESNTFIRTNCTASVEYGLEGAPSWISIDSHGGKIYGRPTSEHLGINPFTVVIKQSGTIYKMNAEILVEGVQHLVDIKLLDNGIICPYDPVTIQMSYEGNLPFGFGIAHGLDTLYRIGINSRDYSVTVNAGGPEFTLVSLWDNVTGEHILNKFVGQVTLRDLEVTGLTKNIAYTDSVFSASIVTENPCLSELVIEIAEGPEWLKVDSATGTLGGTPTYKHLGENIVNLKISEIRGSTTFKNLKIEVLPGLDAAHLPQIQVTPNPFTDVLVLEVRTMEQTGLVISIFDLTGRRCYSRMCTFPKGQHKLALMPELGGGLFNLVIETVTKGGGRKIFTDRLLSKDY